MKKTLACILLILCALCVSMGALAQPLSTGTVMTSPDPYDLTVILPEDMTEVPSTQAFAYGFLNSTMIVGITPTNHTDFDKLYKERFVEGFARETKLTLNGMNARKYTPPADYGIAAIYEVQAKKGNWILELAFYPKDISATKANQACIDQIMDTLRSRSATMKEDFNAKWTTAFSHKGVGLTVRLPASMVKRAKRLSEDSVTEYQNDYLTVLMFVYEGTLMDYVKDFDMNSSEFYTKDLTSNGVPVHVFQPKSASVSTDLAYVVAEGKKGTLLEMIFGANTSAEEEECWKYIDRMISGIQPM